VVAIAPEQCKLLLEWATVAQMAPETSQSYLMSKEQLKQELERLKSQFSIKPDPMQENVEAVETPEASNSQEVSLPTEKRRSWASKVASFIADLIQLISSLLRYTTHRDNDHY
jgi:hypothetical protein